MHYLEFLLIIYIKFLSLADKWLKKAAQTKKVGVFCGLCALTYLKQKT